MIKQIHLIDCDSTQDILKEQLADNPFDLPLLVSCENQHLGRGRGKNLWKMMPGTLCFSLNVSPHIEPSFTALEMSVLITNFFEELGKTLYLKWPNDIWNKQQQKCAGILIQSSHHQMLTGIGVNLFSDDASYGSIFEDEFEIDKKSWAKRIAQFILAHRYKNTNELKHDWHKRCLHMNKEVIIQENSEFYQGIFRGLGTHGEAILVNGQDEMRVYNGSLRLI
jgi:biotin-[acetyl-CoA-carboxylase] ligase BirA-like protein